MVNLIVELLCAYAMLVSAKERIEVKITYKTKKGLVGEFFSSCDF